MNEEVEKAWGQACLSFQHGGHDMQPRAPDRYLYHLAAWLDSVEDDDDGKGSAPCQDSGTECGGAAAVGSAPASSFAEGAAAVGSAQASLKVERLTRSSILEHPLLAPRLAEIYDKARRQNTTLPESLEKFITGILGGDRGSKFFVKGRVKWQSALMDGLHEARAKAWQRSARKHDKDRVKEMAGEWITAEPPWWTHFPRPTWLIAMRLRYALPVTLAMGNILARRCLARKIDGLYCARCPCRCL